MMRNLKQNVKGHPQEQAQDQVWKQVNAQSRNLIWTSVLLEIEDHVWHNIFNYLKQPNNEGSALI